MRLRAFFGPLLAVLAFSVACAACSSNTPGGMYGVTSDCKTPVETCASLCTDACARLQTCGNASPTCLASCRDSYRCAGETPDHDKAICNGQRSTNLPGTCESVCKWAADGWQGCVPSAASDAGADASAD